jgi:uncharacterized protein (DUF2164 family)
MDSPLRIRLSDERRSTLVALLRRHADDEWDEPLSEFRAAGLLDFVLRELGPAVYNQGVRDACAAMQEKLADLEGEVYEPESTSPGGG